MSAHPVAQMGMDVKIGAKNSEAKKHNPVVMAVSPVRPPSDMPAPDSTNVVHGEVPNRDPMEMVMASVQKARVERGNEPSSGSTTPANRAMLYRVPVASKMSTYKKVNSARAKCPPVAPDRFHS